MKRVDNDFRTVHLKFTDKELAEIDAWQKARRIRTRSEAIRQMVSRTLEFEAAAGRRPGLSDKATERFIAPASKGKGAISLEELRELIREVLREEMEKRPERKP